MANRLRIVVRYVQLQILYCPAQKLVRSKSASNHEGLKQWLNAKKGGGFGMMLEDCFDSLWLSSPDQAVLDNATGIPHGIEHK
jgi:hypothetical protein